MRIACSVLLVAALPLISGLPVSPADPAGDGWIELFNGRDLTGWHLRSPERPNRWTVEDGIYTTQARGNDLMSDQEFYDFELHVEFLLKGPSNSGIYMRDRYEIQITDNYGKPPDPSRCGGLYKRTAPSSNACRPTGEWEVYDIVFVGRTLTVHHNGQKIHDRIDVGPKGTGGSSERVDAPGPLRLQGDHGQISFRNVRIRPLSKEEGEKLLLR